MRILNIIIQSVTICGISMAVAFTYNAFSGDGIDPFVKIAEREIVTSSGNSGNESFVVIDLKQLKRMSKESSVLLDARTESDYREGHIPGAILFDYYRFSHFADRVLPLLDPEGKIIVYCSSPLCDSSGFLAGELYMLGYFNVYVYKGGFSNWKKEGFPVEKGLR